MTAYGSGCLTFPSDYNREDLWKEILAMGIAHDCKSIEDVFLDQFSISCDWRGNEMWLEGDYIPCSDELNRFLGNLAHHGVTGYLTLSVDGDEIRIKLDASQANGYLEETGEIRYPSDDPNLVILRKDELGSEIMACAATYQEAMQSVKMDFRKALGKRGFPVKALMAPEINFSNTEYSVEQEQDTLMLKRKDPRNGSPETEIEWTIYKLPGGTVR